MRRRVAAVVLAAAILLGAAGPSHATPPPIKHVFIVVLENENADTTFGASSKAPYLAKTLRSMGQFMPNYFGTGHLSLDVVNCPTHLGVVTAGSTARWKYKKPRASTTSVENASGRFALRCKP